MSSLLWWHGVAGLVREGARSDSPGALTLMVRRSGRNISFGGRLMDADGIDSITSATLTASDSTVADVAGDFTRMSATGFAFADMRRNNRWRSGTLSVTYVDSLFGPRTLSESWSV